MLTKRQLCCGLALACLPQAAVAQFEPVHRGAGRGAGAMSSFRQVIGPKLVDRLNCWHSTLVDNNMDLRELC